MSNDTSGNILKLSLHCCLPISREQFGILVVTLRFAPLDSCTNQGFLNL